MAPQRIVELLWLMLPAYAANMAPPFARFWRGWNRPICVRLFGEHKTVVGFLAGIAVGTLAGSLQGVPALGLLQGAGAMAGDSAKSFFKRRLGIAPGASWMPFDQLDAIAGALLCTWPFVRLSPADVAALLLATFLGTLAVNFLSFKLGIRDTRR